MNNLVKGLLAASVITLSSSALADTMGSSADAGNFDIGVPFQSTINFALGTDEIIKTITVSVNMDHSWVGDVTMTITGPGGTFDLIPTALSDSSNLGIDAGGDVLSPGLYTFADTGSTTIGQAAGGGDSTFEIAPGTYLASDGTATGAGSLDAFYAGSLVNGNWTLDISDSAAGDAGNVNGWSISFTSNPVPVPAAVWLLFSALGGLGFIRRR